MDRQMIYDIVRDHLLNQNSKSDNVTSCLYRGPRGKMCAIGCLIPDALYTKSIENKGVDLLPAKILNALGCQLPSDKSFLSGLQSIHDGTYVENWPAALYEFALENKLRP